MKNKRIIACLAAGVLILSISCTTAFGSVGGYDNLKTAVKTIAFDTENMTAAGNMKVCYDDKVIAAYEGVWKKDGKNTSYQTKETNKKGETTEEYGTTINGVVERYYPERNVIEKYEIEDIKYYMEDKESMNRAYKFIEAGIDTIVGDLKNNFVLTGSTRDSSTYHVSISNYQIPELINAGLAFFAYESTTDMQDSYNLVWEDQDLLIKSKYKEQTNKELPEGFDNRYQIKDWDDDLKSAADEYDEISGETWDYYYQILSSQYNDEGVLYIKADGTYEHFTKIKDVVNKYPDAMPDDLFVYVGNDLILDNVDFTYTTDNENRLTSCEATLLFSTNLDNEIHFIELTGNMEISDYDNTVITPIEAPQNPS